ncbi:MAG: chloride channel protein [Eubacteriales bacterium]|nr:chloride channel protein [Eubacteriales bacterium]
MEKFKNSFQELKAKWPMYKFKIQIMWTKFWLTAKMTIWWIIVAAMVGLAVGAFSSAFAYCLHKVTAFRTVNTWTLFLMPITGLIIVFLYRTVGFEKDPGTNVLIVAIRKDKKAVPALLAPVIYIATLLTHFCGGSAGREGAALQMGGSIGSTIGRIFHIKEKDRKVFVMSGMSAAFSAVFGTPMAAAIFPMEMVSVGVMHYAALVPCVVASLVANVFSSNMGISAEAFHIQHFPVFGVVPGIKIMFLGVCCAVLSMLFCEILHTISHLYSHFFKNPYVKVVAGGLIFIALVKVFGLTDFMGAGTGLIEEAIDGKVVFYAFILKIVMTGITLGAGYKGGEIVPAFTTGATFGYVFGCLVGLSPSLCAAIGMISVFCGVTNCPIASMLIGFELFGFEGVRYLILSVAISYMLSGYNGLYAEQIIMHSKFHTKYRYRFSEEDTFSTSDFGHRDKK